MPRLEDPHFNGTITYVCQHNEEGAMGIVINKAAYLDLNEIFEQLELPLLETESPIEVMQGGPVQVDRGFVLHNDGSSWDSSFAVTKSIQLSTSQDILAAISKGNGPENYLVALGYAGWGPGQLEEEIAQNSWLTCVSSEEVIFYTDTKSRYDRALASIGLDASQLTWQAGHA